MKILILTNNIRPNSGWGRCASDLVLGIRRAGHEVIVLKEENDSCEGTQVLRRGARLFFSAIQVRKYLKTCDIIHAIDGYPNGIIAALATMGLNKKFIITSIGTYSVDPLYNWKLSALQKWAYKRADHVICISQFTKNQIQNKIKLKNISVINLGIDFNKFYKDHKVSEKRFIISVGALKYRKGYHISIPAFILAKEKFPELKYKIVGSHRDVGYFNYLKDIIKKQGAEKSIEFLNDISDKELTELYGYASIFVLTSVNRGYQFEGYGLVFLEAAAASLPVIGTKGNGIEDAVKDGYNGILVNQGDIENTARAITDLLGDKNKWLNMSKNSLEWSKSNDVDLMIKQYLNLYK